MSLGRLVDQADRLRVVVARLVVTLIGAQDVAERIERADVLRVLGDDVFEQRLGLIDALQRRSARTPSESAHSAKAADPIGDGVEGRDLEVVFLGAVVGLGKRDWASGKVGLQQ